MSDIPGFDRAQADHDNAEPADDGVPLCEACGEPVPDDATPHVVEIGGGGTMNVCQSCFDADVCRDDDGDRA